MNVKPDASAHERTPPALELRDIRKSFGATPVIRGVSLDVHEGERHAIIGPNGAGKTTFIKILTTLLFPTAAFLNVIGVPVGVAALVAIDPSPMRRGIRASSTSVKLAKRLTNPSWEFLSSTRASLPGRPTGASW